MVDSTKVVYFDQNIWSRIANRGLPEMSFEETLNWFRRVQKRGDFIFILSYPNIRGFMGIICLEIKSFGFAK